MDPDTGSFCSRGSSPEMGNVPSPKQQPHLPRSEQGDPNREISRKVPARSKSKRVLSEGESQQLRLRVNCRERRRMQDLNVAMDGLREVMPCGHGASVRKLSKIATLLFARNYILMLSDSLDQMKKLLPEVYGGYQSCGHPPAAQLPLQPLPAVATLPIGFLGIHRAPAAPPALFKGSAPLSGGYWSGVHCPFSPHCRTAPQHPLDNRSQHNPPQNPK